MSYLHVDNEEHEILRKTRAFTRIPFCALYTSSNTFKHPVYLQESEFYKKQILPEKWAPFLSDWQKLFMYEIFITNCNINRKAFVLIHSTEKNSALS